MPTEKLYWEDSFAMTFEARGGVALGSSWGEQPSVVLPRTLFYPEAGGQLGDTGALCFGEGTFEVTDTQVGDDGVIHHIVGQAPPEDALRQPMRGTVDRARRLDHMAHHTAQHMLSSALADVAKAETVSARLGRATCTIDLDVPQTREADLARAEELVNAVIRDDVAVRALFPTPAELARMKLRRAPKVSDGIRVIDIEGFDLSPCGGTHCTRTGQIGLIRVSGTERYKGKMRISFHAAARALADAQAKDRSVATLMAELTCGMPDLAASLGKLKGDLQSSRQALGVARAELAGLVADAALASHPQTGAGDTRIVVVRDADDVATLRVLAGRLASRPDVVAVCLSRDGAGDLSVVVQRGASSTFDCGAWLKGAAAGGRGGGRPERAEGKLPVSALASLLPEAPPR